MHAAAVVADRAGFAAADQAADRQLVIERKSL